MEKHMNVPMTKEEAAGLKSGDYVYLTGTIYTARDAAHKRMDETLDRGEKLPLDIGSGYLLHGPFPGKGRPSHRVSRPYNGQPDGQVHSQAS